MIDIKYIREHTAEVKKNCEIRKVAVDIDELLRVDTERRELLQKIEVLRKERNENSKTKGKPSPEMITRMKEVGEEIKKFESAETPLEESFHALLMQVPNFTHPDTPVGGEDDFKVVTEHLKPTEFSFTPKDHEELMLQRDWVDFERGAKVAGSKFYFAKHCTPIFHIHSK